jgi:two-component system, LytTR family, response regulator
MHSSILIADDEPLARRSLRTHLSQLGLSTEIHEAPDGKSAIAVANKHRPRLLFLDIVMPGATGLQVLERLEYEPQVVFTTAHDQYAVTAFELGALDYLLKPFGKERLVRLLARIEAMDIDSSVSVVDRAQESLSRRPYLSRIFVRDGNRIVPIPLTSLERVQGADDYVTVHTLNKEYLVSVRLSELETHLSTLNFLRIHRSHIINLELIESIEPYDTNRVTAVMKSGARVVASRSGSRLLRSLAY